MRFPLSIVKEFATEQGYGVLSTPKNLRDTFDWVTTASSPSDKPSFDLLYVTDIVTCEDAERHAMVSIAKTTSATPAERFVLDCRGDSSTQVAEALQIYLVKIYQWVEDMHQALSRHCDCTELLAISEPILKNFVSVNDSAFYHIAHTPGIEPIEEASRYFLKHGRYSPEIIATVGSSGLSELWSKSHPYFVYDSNAINPKPSIDHVYHLNSQYAAHLVMVCEKPITEGQAFLFSLLIGPIGTALDYLWRTDNPLKKRYTSFLADIIHGASGPHESARQQAEALGLPLRGIFKVCVISEPWKGSSENYFAERVLTLLPGCWALADKNDIVVLLQQPESSRTGRLASLEEKTFELAMELGTQVGVSRKFFNLFEASKGVEEARIALKYGKARCSEFLSLGEQREGNPIAHIFRFKRYFPFYVGDPHAYKADFFRRHDLAREIIGAIEDNDRRSGTSDALVLKVYLRMSCRINATAEELGMHRNSVAYRIKHIEKAYDFDLNDPDETAFLNALFMLPR